MKNCHRRRGAQMFLRLLRGRSASRLQFRRRRERGSGQFPSHMLEQERRGAAPHTLRQE